MSKTILVTGACGNLGLKLVKSLTTRDEKFHVIALDLLPAAASPYNQDKRVAFVQADLTDPYDTRWIDAVKKADAIVHFAVRNPSPDASWEDATASLAMTKNLLDTAIAHKIERFIFASSNHVMGGYKEKFDYLKPGSLSSDTPMLPGTAIRENNGSYRTSLPYAIAKVMGECYCREETEKAGRTTTTISVRIGWCQPGENKLETISASGTPKAEWTTVDPDYERDMRWFRSMWLSNHDFIDLFTRAIMADASAWPNKAIIVNGMSDNSGMPWDIEMGKRLIGYNPKEFTPD